MTTHAILPPSSADKWMVCTAWLQAVKGLPSKPSIYADEGTEAHAILEWCLRLGCLPEELCDNDDMCEAIGHAVDWLTQYRVQNPSARYWIERRLHYGRMIGYPDQSGTADLSVVTDDELVVVDYKHGAGVVVEVETSKQLRLYLLGLIHEFGLRKKYKIVIVQPRIRHHDGPVRIHDVTPAEMKAFAKEVQNAAKANFENTGKRKAGDHCRFCPAAPSCRELARFSLSIAVKEFSSRRAR